MIMVNKFRVNEKKSINNSNKTINNILILVLSVFSIASIDTGSTGATIAYIGDAEPKTASDIQEFTKDLDQVIPLSPTGKVDALFLMGDMETISNTLKSVNASTAKDIPIYFVIGNYEAGSNSETALIQSRYSNSSFLLAPGPPGTDRTTYSMNVGNMHIINMNEYWDGATDDSYGNGYIQDALYNWISNDLSGTTRYKIVVGHDPLYPVGRHVNDSLDANITNRDNLQALFVSKNVDLFIGGHTHNAGLQNISGIFHANSGTSGTGPNPDGKDSLGPEDSFASILYTYTNDTGSLLLTWKRENLTWDTPAAITYTINNVISSSTIPPQPWNLKYTMGNYWVNHTWQAGTGVVTDAFNISVNGVWYNGTDQYYNDSAGASNWSDITIWAWNNSGSGNMSVLSVSQNVQAPSLPPPINIINYAPLSPIIDNEGATRAFNITFNETVNLTWYINRTQVSSNSSVTAGNYTNSSAKSGTWNVSAVANNSNGTVVKTWIWIVSGLIANPAGPYTGTPNVLINFTGSASGGTAPYSYNWSFGDGWTSSLTNPAHAYLNRGDYTAILTVTDSVGITSSVTAPVSVEWVRFINGTVIDGDSKSGVSGVKILTDTGLSTMTDTTGFYSFSINSGTYNIIATLEPVYYQNSTTVSLLSAVEVRDIELLKKPTGNITGIIG